MTVLVCGDFSRPTPDLGEHTAVILTEWGRPLERIAGLFATGAVFRGGVLARTVAAL